MGAVRFLKSWSLYNSGEIASFDDETTALLIDSGVAVSATKAKAADKAAEKAAAKQAAAEVEAAKKAAEEQAAAEAEAVKQNGAS